MVNPEWSANHPGNVALQRRPPRVRRSAVTAATRFFRCVVMSEPAQPEIARKPQRVLHPTLFRSDELSVRSTIEYGLTADRRDTDRQSADGNELAYGPLSSKGRSAVGQLLQASLDPLITTSQLSRRRNCRRTSSGHGEQRTGGDARFSHSGGKFCVHGHLTP